MVAQLLATHFKSPIVIFSGLTLIIFFERLGLFANPHLSNLAKYLPSYFVKFSYIINGQGEFVLLRPGQGIAVLMIWTVLIGWLTSVRILHSQKYHQFNTTI